MSRTVWELDDYNKKEIYGFINELGELVIPVEYTGFHYGLDGQNRFRYLLACQESRTDIYTLDGKKVLSLPSGRRRHPGIGAGQRHAANRFRRRTGGYADNGYAV